MSLGIDVTHNVTDHTPAIDHNRAAADAQLSHAVFFALFQYIVALAHVAVIIGQQLNRQTMLVTKRGVANAIIARNAIHDGLITRKLCFEIAEVNRLKGACRRVVFRIKIQDNILLPTHIGEPDHLHTGIGQMKIRRCVSNSEHQLAPSSLMREFYLKYSARKKPRFEPDAVWLRMA